MGQLSALANVLFAVAVGLLAGVAFYLLQCVVGLLTSLGPRRTGRHFHGDWTDGKPPTAKKKSDQRR